MSKSKVSYVDLVNSLDQISVKLKQKVIENVFSLEDLVEVSNPEESVMWRLTKMKGVRKSKVEIIHQAAKEELDRRQEIISEREKNAEERKIKAFKRENPQPIFDKISMKLKEETWQNIGENHLGLRHSPNWPLSGNCEFCVNQVSLPESPWYNETCYRHKHIMEIIEDIMDLGSHYGNMNRDNTHSYSVRRRNMEVAFLSYTMEVSFYWVIYPSLRVVLACDSCAENKKLLE